MQKLNYLHEPALLHNLSHRFARDHVYTYTGKICISINPFNWDVSAPLYTQVRAATLGCALWQAGERVLGVPRALAGQAGAEEAQETARAHPWQPLAAWRP